MSKRRHSRFVRRLETEFTAQDQHYRAISSDFSCSGLFIRTNHAFPPETLIDITIHLPGGKTSVLKGKVRRALKTTVVSLKNGMGIELIEKDQNYSDFMLSFTRECDEPASKPEPGLTPMDTPTEPSGVSETPVSEAVIIACRACGVKNKVRVERLSQGPKCGKCGVPLPAD